MNILKITREKFQDFLIGMQKHGEVHIPKKKTETTYVYDIMDSPDEIAYEYLRTILPVKKYFIKPKEKLIKYSFDSGFSIDLEDPDKKVIIFGLHPCDINSLKILDLAFSGKYVDPYYFNRRKNTVIFGLGCMPDEKCFCRSMGTDHVTDGYDLYFNDLGDFFLVNVGSSLGDDFIKEFSDLFEKPEPEDIDIYIEKRNLRAKSFKLQLDVSDLPYILDIERESEVWNELGNKCLCCGSCSMVCPTCYCFNIFDTIDLDGKSGERYRQWDTCLSKDYTLVAGGHVFRKNRADRVKNRYYHKQHGFVEEYGRPSCTGCGRCIQFCPTKIHVVEVLNKVMGKS
jgi:sulfhydrogenase subunit beta (sulfur reductase)